MTVIFIILLAKKFNIHKRMSLIKITRLENLRSFVDKNYKSIEVTFRAKILEHKVH